MPPEAFGKRVLSWQNGAVPMRQDCKNFESRTYAGGETVRKCNIDLAPEAPWRCPNPCRGYEPRLADVEAQRRRDQPIWRRIFGRRRTS